MNAQVLFQFGEFVMTAAIGSIDGAFRHVSSELFGSAALLFTLLFGKSFSKSYRFFALAQLRLPPFTQNLHLCERLEEKNHFSLLWISCQNLVRAEGLEPPMNFRSPVPKTGALPFCYARKTQG